MQLHLKQADPVTLRTDCLVIGVHADGKFPAVAKKVDDATGGLLTRLVKQGDLKGTVKQALLVHGGAGIHASRIVLAGLGEQGKPLTRIDATRMLLAIAGVVKGLPMHSVTLMLDDVRIDDAVINGNETLARQWLIREAARVFDEATYKFDEYKSKPAAAKPAKSAKAKKEAKTPKLESVTLAFADHRPDAGEQKTLAAAEAISAGRRLARDLGNLPPNHCHPVYLAERAQKLATESGKKLKVTILDEKKIRALGMGAFMAVAQGSDQPGRIIAMEYRGGKPSDKPYVFVGKGITFDTGGISLKPGAGMDEMKFDMCGAASVFGLMKAVTELKLPINVVGVVAAAENMPSGRASRPGDIVKTMSGQTVEILNTDAEGRLVLCDALTWVAKFKPETVIDIATLTGACVVALGSHPHGMYSNDAALATALLNAGNASNDRAWQMPMWDEYQEQLDSPFADIANIGGPKAGSVTAACFLSRFTKDYRWAHFDIAGTAWHSGSPYKGATGRPVALLVQYLLDAVAAKQN